MYRIVFAILVLALCSLTNGQFSCANTNLFAIQQAGGPLDQPTASSNCAALTGTCGQKGRLAQLGTSVAQSCVAANTTYTGNNVWIAGTDASTEGTWVYPSLDSCSTHQFFLRGTGNTAPYVTNWNNVGPSPASDSGKNCIQRQSPGGAGDWVDVSCSASTAFYACEWNLCTAVSGTLTVITAVPALSDLSYQFTADGSTLQLNFGSQFNYKVSVDVNGHHNCVIQIGSNTELGYGLEILDTQNIANTNVIVKGTDSTSKVSHIIASAATGVKLQGTLAFTCRCSGSLCGIQGTISNGDLVFDGVTITGNQNILVQLATGNIAFNANTNLAVNSFLATVNTADATISCTDSVITASSSASYTASGHSWSGVSVGLANIAGNSNSAASSGVKHLYFQRCAFSGPVRGYFNYFNRQSNMPGNVIARDTNFTFGGKLRVRSYSDSGHKYVVDLTGSRLTMNGGSLPLSIGDPFGTTSTVTSYSDVVLDNVVATSAGFLEVYGKNITGSNANLNANGDVTVKIVLVVAPPP